MKHIKTFATERGYVGTIYQSEDSLFYGVIINPYDIIQTVPSEDIEELSEQIGRHMASQCQAVERIDYVV